MDKDFIYHHAENYTLIMTSAGEGVCSVSIDDAVKSGAWIYGLSVNERHQRKGYGNKLLMEAEKVDKVLGQVPYHWHPKKVSSRLIGTNGKAIIHCFQIRNTLHFTKNSR